MIKRRTFLTFGPAGLLFIGAITGCETGGPNEGGALSGVTKTRGIYATLALRERSLDMPGSGYLQKSSFGPGETPAAVVVGYGTYNQPELITLELVELSTGRSLFTRDYSAHFGKALLQPLAIRLSGNYKLRLLLGGTEYDACQIAVTRAKQPGSAQAENTSSSPSYARGLFSASLECTSSSLHFADYDGALSYALLNAATKEASRTPGDLFAQRSPGRVVIQCRLDSKGHLTECRILENTLDDACGEAFERGLESRSPYAAWPEEMRQKLGADSRLLKVTLRFD